MLNKQYNPIQGQKVNRKKEASKLIAGFVIFAFKDLLNQEEAG
ncbi:hypothetical protein N824_10300 [Pedobacter sp. V48]|nr:hypothetical protein N824_10300 [Pedobacter sp. V48]